jgi:hypothetical protein
MKVNKLPTVEGYGKDTYLSCNVLTFLEEQETLLQFSSHFEPVAIGVKPYGSIIISHPGVSLGDGSLNIEKI